MADPALVVEEEAVDGAREEHAHRQPSREMESNRVKVPGAEVAVLRQHAVAREAKETGAETRQLIEEIEIGTPSGEEEEEMDREVAEERDLQRRKVA